MNLLVALLIANALLHAAVVARFGATANKPPLVFGLVYAGLAVAAMMHLPQIAWVVLVVVLVGSAGLIASWRKLGHDPLIERGILVLNAALLILVARALFF